MCLSLGQFANMISFPLSSTVGVISVVIEIEFAIFLNSIWVQVGVYCTFRNVFGFVFYHTVPHNKLHSLFSCKFLILAAVLWYVFLSLRLYMAYLPVGVCKSVPVCSNLWLELVQFLFDMRGCCV